MRKATAATRAALDIITSLPPEVEFKLSVTSDEEEEPAVLKIFVDTSAQGTAILKELGLERFLGLNESGGRVISSLVVYLFMKDAFWELKHTLEE